MAILMSGCALFTPCDTVECRADARLKADVENAIDQHAALRFPAIDVTTHAGTVYLRGVVDTNLERLAAEKYARDVPGVVDVVNELGINNSRG